jgi:hypothetical protein
MVRTLNQQENSFLWYNSEGGFLWTLCDKSLSIGRIVEIDNILLFVNFMWWPPLNMSYRRKNGVDFCEVYATCSSQEVMSLRMTQHDFVQTWGADFSQYVMSSRITQSYFLRALSRLKELNAIWRDSIFPSWIGLLSLLCDFFSLIDIHRQCS